MHAPTPAGNPGMSLSEPAQAALLALDSQSGVTGVSNLARLMSSPGRQVTMLTAYQAATELQDLGLARGTAPGRRSLRFELTSDGRALAAATRTARLLILPADEIGVPAAASGPLDAKLRQLAALGRSDPLADYRWLLRGRQGTQ